MSMKNIWHIRNVFVEGEESIITIENIKVGTLN